MYIVLMAGGVGTRFWPLSKTSFPKQLLNILGERSMLQLTYDRIKGMTSDDKILVITNADLKDAVCGQLPMIPQANIIAEPFGRNTAPCIGLAATIIQKRASTSEVMVVLPADHLIEDVEKFRNTISVAVDYAQEGSSLITLGIRPRYPETGYGYIQKNGAVAVSGERSIFKVKTFAEKPNLETAQRFLHSGDFLWNSGIFIWSTKKIMDEFDEHLPDMSELLSRLKNKVDSPRLDKAIQDVYSKIKSISIDYGIMEVSDSVCIIEADFSWNDVGSWEAVYNISAKDKANNVIAHASEKCLIESRNNYIHVSNKLVALIDVEGLVVVETEDALLICKKDQSQKVKEIVDQLRRKRLEQYL